MQETPSPCTIKIMEGVSRVKLIINYTEIRKKRVADPLDDTREGQEQMTGGRRQEAGGRSDKESDVFHLLIIPHQ